MDRPIDDDVLGVLDDYWEALRCDDTERDDTEDGLTTRSRPTVADGEPQEFLELLEDLDDARRMLQEDSRRQLDNGAFALDEPPALPKQFGRYRIQRQLGMGGMGAVFLVHDTQLQRDVALKVPQFSRADDKAVRERFLREARAAATLNHANICPVYDIGEIDGVLYLTMAFIDGKPLTCGAVDAEPEGAPEASALPSRERDRDAAMLVRKVALALDHAHSKGIVHRDLKPGNIMLDRRGEPIVVDFGLARRTEVQDATLTRQGMILGSLAYMSPEQTLGEHERVGPASDIYSLGVIFYELLTGQLPYRGRRSGALGHIVSPDPAELTHRSDLDPDLREICAKALAKRAEERFASMAEFAAALQNYLDGTGGTAGTYAGPASLASRLRVGVVSGAVLLLAMFAVAFGLIVIKLQTADGTLVVEVNEPGAKVTVLNERGEVEITRASDGGTLKLSVDPGKHRLKVEKDGFAIFTKEFSIAAGAMEPIKATLAPPQSVASDARVAIPAPPGLIAWWSGDGHALDYVGENHGIPLRGATFATGLVGKAFSLDGLDDTIRVPNSDALNPRSGFTFECWIYPKLMGGWQKFISKWGTLGESYDLQKVNGSDVLRFDLTESPSRPNNLAMLDGKSRILVNQWTHIAATYDNNIARVYFNGRLDGEVTVGPGRPIHASAVDLLIGSNTGHCFCGLMDELSLYDRVLCAAEIEAIYVAGAAGKIKP